MSLERPRALAERLHRGCDELLAHLQRVASAVPHGFRSVAWLHHAHRAAVTRRALAAAGLTDTEVRAVDLLAYAVPAVPEDVRLPRIQAIAGAPGSVGHLARVVAHAALKDRLGGACPTGEALTALGLLGDPRKPG
jgi:hypothetical protein